MRSLTRIAAALAALTPLYAQYGGPAVLTRGEAPTGMAASQIDFRPFLSLDFGYNTGLNGVAIDPNGKAVNVNSTTIAAVIGVSGVHSWKHTSLGLDYRANFRHEFHNSYYDGTDQLLFLSLKHQFSRHTGLALRETAGLSSQSTGVPFLQQSIAFDPTTSYIPTNDFFDNRTMFFSTQADLQMQRSTRLSFDIGADGFMTRRRSTALYGVKGAAARGDIQYRVSRVSTLGVLYTYAHYSFTGIFSSTDLHTAAGTYSVRLSKTVEASGSAGITFYETKFAQDVPIDPVIAAIIGVGSAKQVSYNIRHIPTFAGRISKVIPRGILSLTGARAISPGNGLFLTSSSTTVSAGYAYTGLKRWAVSSSASYITADSVGNVIGNYHSFAASAGISRQVLPSTHAILSFSASKYGSHDFHNYNKWSYYIHLGVGFTPGDYPIRLW